MDSFTATSGDSKHASVLQDLRRGTKRNRMHWEAWSHDQPMSRPPNYIRRKETLMSDEIPPPPFIYEGLDPALEEKSVIGEGADALKGTAQRIGEAVDSGRKPGMPLSVLSNIAREAPLGSLLIAFLLGVAIARRR